jgi:hypothetical protein
MIYGAHRSTELFQNKRVLRNPSRKINTKGLQGCLSKQYVYICDAFNSEHHTNGEMNMTSLFH